jgi:hypothetical protein
VNSSEEKGDALDFTRQWELLSALPASPRTEAEKRAILVQWGARDFLQACQFAQSAGTAREREMFRNAALQGWATSDPEGAATWMLAHVRPQERRAAAEAMATGAVARPEAALRAFHSLVGADPDLASDHGNILVSAFAHIGAFEDAQAFALSGPREHQAAWLANVYQTWGQSAPKTALVSLEGITEATMRGAALNALFAGWASSEPAALVAHAQTLPAGDVRLQALREGLTQWVFRDSAAASDWMDRFDPNPDLDAGAAALAVMPTLVQKKPDVATSWAESISDPELRANTLLDLIRLWAEHDVSAARHYAMSSPALRPETRALALSTLNAVP